MRLKVRLRIEIKNDKIRDYGLSLCCVCVAFFRIDSRDV